MTFTFLLALSALAISTVSAYFSIAGLVAIFAASAIPIIIMGSCVEFGKIVSVAWVHYHWAQVNLKLKSIIVTCIAIAMVLTSVGVFGFLSKAHVTQTAASDESVAQVQRIEVEVERQKSIIARGEIKIVELESSGSNLDQTIQTQIDNEQERMDAAAQRMQPAIDEQNAIIASQTKLYHSQIVAIDDELDRLQAYIDAGEITKAQQLIGEKSRGGWGPKTAETARLWREERTNKKAELYNKIEDVSQNNTAILAARKEISRIRQAAEKQLAESNRLINRLRTKLGNTDATNVDELIDEQYLRISNANKIIEELTNEKYELEAEFRQLEAEVGPIKYIAEFVYGEEPDRNLLEKAVRWVIIMLLLVLDPFAVTLVMAATDGYKWNRKKKEEKFNADVASGKIQFIEKEVEKIVEVPVEVERIVEVPTEDEDRVRELSDQLSKLQEDNALLAKQYPPGYEDDLQHEKDKTELLQKELDKFRTEYDSLINSIEEVYDKSAVAEADKHAEELAMIKRERDNLKTELETLAKDIGIVQSEVAKVPLLEKELEGERRKIKQLEQEIITATRPEINTAMIREEGTRSHMRHEITLLEEKIERLLGLTPNLKDTIELEELKERYTELETRLASVTADRKSLMTQLSQKR